MNNISSSAIGIGLRSPHYQQILNSKPDIDFLEVHSENYFNVHSKNYHYLEQIAEHYPLSMHGIGLSLGSNESLSAQHLNKLKELVTRFQPALVSDHLSWCSFAGQFYNDLLPIPYTQESLDNFVNNVNQVQDTLQRQILIENPSSYLQYKQAEMAEPEFLNQLCKQTGCGLVLDLNNIYVSASNHQFSAHQYLAKIDVSTVQEIHLAGHSEETLSQDTLLIDTHSKLVSQPVWSLYRHFLNTTNSNIATLIEWDVDIPPLQTLLDEADRAKAIQETL